MVVGLIDGAGAGMEQFVGLLVVVVVAVVVMWEQQHKQIVHHRHHHRLSMYLIHKTTMQRFTQQIMKNSNNWFTLFVHQG